MSKRIKVFGWKFRCKGEYAHYFHMCRSECDSCESGNSHAYCQPSITVGWLEKGGFSDSQPPHRACERCAAIVAENKRIASLGWRERIAIKGRY